MEGVCRSDRPRIIEVELATVDKSESRTIIMHGVFVGSPGLPCILECVLAPPRVAAEPITLQIRVTIASDLIWDYTFYYKWWRTQHLTLETLGLMFASVNALRSVEVTGHLRYGNREIPHEIPVMMSVDCEWFGVTVQHEDWQAEYPLCAKWSVFSESVDYVVPAAILDFNVSETDARRFGTELMEAVRQIDEDLHGGAT